MKCKVKDCENHSDQGLFIGFLCMPCFTFLNTGEGVFSQLYRNTVIAEREACAVICENDEDYSNGDVNYHSTLIRARGK